MLTRWRSRPFCGPLNGGQKRQGGWKEKGPNRILALGLFAAPKIGFENIVGGSQRQLLEWPFCNILYICISFVFVSCLCVYKDIYIYMHIHMHDVYCRVHTHVSTNCHFFKFIFSATLIRLRTMCGAQGLTSAVTSLWKIDMSLFPCLFRFDVLFILFFMRYAHYSTKLFYPLFRILSINCIRNQSKS